MEEPEYKLTAFDRLNAQQQAYVLAYVGEARFNGRKAAEIAGYAWADEGSRLKAKFPDVRQAIDDLIAERALTAAEVLDQIREIATGAVDELLVACGSGVRIDLKRLIRAGKAHLVKSVKRTKNGWEIEFYSRHEALRDLGRHHRLFADRVEHSGPAGGPILISEVVVEMPPLEDEPDLNDDDDFDPAAEDAEADGEDGEGGYIA